MTEEILAGIMHLFNICLKNGEFPGVWKCANLVLIPKDNKSTASGLPKVRPICLIDEMCKAFERVIVERISQWQSDHPELMFPVTSLDSEGIGIHL